MPCLAKVIGDDIWIGLRAPLDRLGYLPVPPPSLQGAHLLVEGLPERRMPETIAAVWVSSIDELFAPRRSPRREPRPSRRSPLARVPRHVRAHHGRNLEENTDSLMSRNSRPSITCSKRGGTRTRSRSPSTSGPPRGAAPLLPRTSAVARPHSAGTLSVDLEVRLQACFVLLGRRYGSE